MNILSKFEKLRNQFYCFSHNHIEQMKQAPCLNCYKVMARSHIGFCHDCIDDVTLI